MAKETTDTILEKLQANSAEYVVVRIDRTRFLIPIPALKLLAWNAIPDMIKDEKSKEAQEARTLRLGIKALIRPFLPEILKKTWGSEVELTPGLNILGWLPKYFVHYFVAFLASKEWRVHVEKCGPCGEDTWKIAGISPDTHNQGNGALPAPRADSEPLQRGTEPDPHRAADSDFFRRSMGGSGGPAFREEHMGTGASEAPTAKLSSNEDVHP